MTDQQRTIVEGIQPYARPSGLTQSELTFNYNRAMGILNDWARKDRHRKLHVVAIHAANIRPLSMIPVGIIVSDFTVVREMFVLDDESIVATFKVEDWHSGMKIQANPNMTMDIVADEIPLPCHETDTLNVRGWA